MKKVRFMKKHMARKKPQGYEKQLRSYKRKKTTQLSIYRYQIYKVTRDTDENRDHKLTRKTVT